MAALYEIRNVVSGRRYVGSSVSPEKRQKEHFKMLRKGKHHCVALQRASDKYGESALVFKVLAVVEDSLQLDMEDLLINALRFDEKLYNTALSAFSSMKNRKHSAEVKARMSRQLMGNTRCVGRVPHNKGVPMSEEQKAKMSQAKKNPSQETRAKMRAAKVGKAPHNKGMRMTVCGRGHAVEGANLYIHPGRGTHVCKACLKINSENRKRGTQIGS